MAGLEIGLIIVGILIFAGSFFITEKLSSSDMKEIAKISEDEVKSIVDNRIAESKDVIDERLHNKLEDAVNDFAIRTDDEYVAKMNQMNEYSEKVLTTMDKTNNEIVFIHSMLNDKQETVTDMTAKLDVMKSQLLQLKNDVDERLNELSEQYEENIKLQKEAEFVNGINAEAVEQETVKSFEEDLIDRINEDNDAPEGFKEALITSAVIKGEDQRLDSVSEPAVESDAAPDAAGDVGGTAKALSGSESDIVKLYKEGYSEIDIAKKLGKGIGEIKLVLGLYNQ